jgi:hypothetical protein
MPWEVTLWVRDAGHGYVEFAKNLGHQSLRKAIKACSSRLARDAIAYETAMQAINKVA